MIALSSGLVASSADTDGDFAMAIGDVGNGVQTTQPKFAKGTMARSVASRITPKPEPDDPPQQGPKLPNPTDETLQWAASLAPDVPATFTILLTERSFNWHELQGLENDARATVIERRKAT